MNNVQDKDEILMATNESYVDYLQDCDTFGILPSSIDKYIEFRDLFIKKFTPLFG